MSTTEPTPTSLDIPTSYVDKLLQRVRDYSWDELPEVESNDWDHGCYWPEVKRLSDVLTDSSKFQWQSVQQKLNKCPQYHITVNDTKLHFLHIRCGSDNEPGVAYRRPEGQQQQKALLLVHGWPGSVHEFWEAIDLFQQRPELSGYDLIVPSLPGYYLSGPMPGFPSARRTAALFDKLLSCSGYTHYIAQGGDWGGAIVAWMAHDFPKHCIGVHCNYCNFAMHGVSANTDEEQQWRSALDQKRAVESGYNLEQSTKPHTLGLGATDPVFVLGWILEKVVGWSDLPWGKSGVTPPEKQPHDLPDIHAVYTDEQILTVVMQYLLTRSFASSLLMYRGRAIHDPPMLLHPVTVPAGVSAFPDPFSFPPPESYAKQMFTNLVRYTRPEKGGHFAAHEQPRLFVEEVAQFIATISRTQSST